MGYPASDRVPRLPKARAAQKYRQALAPIFREAKKGCRDALRKLVELHDVVVHELCEHSPFTALRQAIEAIFPEIVRESVACANSVDQFYDALYRRTVRAVEEYDQMRSSRSPRRRRLVATAC